MKKPLGIVFESSKLVDVVNSIESLRRWLKTLNLNAHIELQPVCKSVEGNHQQSVRLSQSAFHLLTPAFDTFSIVGRLNDVVSDDQINLTREILVAYLASPFLWKFSSFEALCSAIRVRINIVEAAKKTALNFHTSEAERPEDMWTYHEDTGFVILPGASLIDALIKATQPGISGTYYSFSCYRATEYVILLALAQEASKANPHFYRRLEQQWQTRAIMSGKFHDVFLTEHGTMESPLPLNYYVPGDRIWFRNPDDRSSDIEGFEGSWVFYLGQGMFPNFWKLDQAFTLKDKCLEVFHWRDGVVNSANGELKMDEQIVDREVAISKSNPVRADAIMKQMYRLRDPKGVYADGGCMDATRESPKAILGDFDVIRLDV